MTVSTAKLGLALRARSLDGSARRERGAHGCFDEHTEAELLATHPASLRATQL